MNISRRQFILRNGILIPFAGLVLPRIAFPQVVLPARKDVRFPPAAVGGGGASAFTFVNSAYTENTTAPVLNGVTAGNLIIFVAVWEGSATLSSVSDGTSSLSLRSENVWDNKIQMAYLLSANSGDRTYTPTFSGTPSARTITYVAEFSAGGTHTFSTDIITGHANTGTTIVTGNVTNGGTHRLNLMGYGSFGAVVSAPLIGSVSAVLDPSTVPDNNCRMAYNAEQLSSEQGQFTQSPSFSYTLSMICFASD
jgi:hypothetical protein